MRRLRVFIGVAEKKLSGVGLQALYNSDKRPMAKLLANTANRTPLARLRVNDTSVGVPAKLYCVVTEHLCRVYESSKTVPDPDDFLSELVPSLSDVSCLEI